MNGIEIVQISLLVNAVIMYGVGVYVKITSDVLMNINGHNIYSTNKRHICKKCGLIEKIEN